MHYVVTGAAGFIGSRLVAALNRTGITDILAVDNLENGAKAKNLAGVNIEDYLDKREFLSSSKLAGWMAASRRSCTRARAPTPWRPTAAT